MELTQSWRTVLPASLLDRYEVAETRNAAAAMRATTAEAFQEMLEVLEGFTLTLDQLTTPGGNKSVVARELDEAFRERGWREARFDQVLETTLTIYRWPGAPSAEQDRLIATAHRYGGHKVDNVKGRAALDVEWNPKDGNLDRDLANYVSLHEAGILDVGVIITRTGDRLREFVRELIQQVKDVAVPVEYEGAWRRRMDKLANDPLGTTTTSNMGKLVPRLERGDGRGCPILAIAATNACYEPPEGGLEAEVRRLAELVTKQASPLTRPVGGAESS